MHTHLVEVGLRVPPLLVLGHEPLEHERHGHHGVALQPLQDVVGLVAVDAADGAGVDRRRTAA